MTNTNPTKPIYITKTITRSLIDIFSSKTVEEIITLLTEYKEQYLECTLTLDAEYDSDGATLILRHTRLETLEETQKRLDDNLKYIKQKESKKIHELKYLAKELGYSVIENPSLENLNG